MHGFLFAAGCVGITYGWVARRLNYAWADHKGAVARLKGAKRERRRAVLWAAGFAVVAWFILSWLF
jgi:hypothetical protein